MLPRLWLADALRLNRARLRLPGVDGSILVRCDHDVDAFYEDGEGFFFAPKRVPLTRRRPAEVWCVS